MPKRDENVPAARLFIENTFVERGFSMCILFYNPNEPYGCFSNFSQHGFLLEGVWWPTSEHYFQAQKFAGTYFAEEIRLAAGPGRRRDWPLRPDWEAVKEEVMRRALRAKFHTHKELRAMLLETGNEL